MTVHKQGRQEIAVSVQVNYEDEIISSRPISQSDDAFETLNDFKSVP